MIPFDSLTSVAKLSAVPASASRSSVSRGERSSARAVAHSAVDSGSVYMCSPASIAQLPFCQALWPAITPLENGQNAQTAAATRPTERRPVA